MVFYFFRSVSNLIGLFNYTPIKVAWAYSGDKTVPLLVITVIWVFCFSIVFVRIWHDLQGLIWINIIFSLIINYLNILSLNYQRKKLFFEIVFHDKEHGSNIFVWIFVIFYGFEVDFWLDMRNNLKNVIRGGKGRSKASIQKG